MRSPGDPGPQTAKSNPAGPFVGASEAPAEFTGRAILLGAVFGVLFGASTVYLGLRAGLTVGASIPIAVLAISALKRLGHPTILENNMVQTIGSAGESVAAGVVFTLPALLFLLPSGPDYFSYGRITLLTLAGGLLGVLMMVPLRRTLIEREHDTLPYPEGTACAEVLVAGERGGALAGQVFAGLGLGLLVKAFTWIFTLFRGEIGYSLPATSPFPNATLTMDTSPEYLGVGRASHRRHDGRGRRAVLARPPAAALTARSGHHRAAATDPPEHGQQPGHGGPVSARRDVSRTDLECLHPLHRRRCRSGCRSADAGQDPADHRDLGAEQSGGGRSCEPWRHRPHRP